MFTPVSVCVVPVQRITINSCIYVHLKLIVPLTVENVNDFDLQYVGMTICLDNNSLSVTFSVSMQN